VNASVPPVAQRSETIVVRWVDAFNERDLDRMLACLAPDVDFHPLRLSGLASRYRGHDGVREWFRRSRRLRHQHQIGLCEVRDVGQRQVFAAGSLSLAGEAEIGPFCALHRIRGGLIAVVYQYLTDPDMIEQLGLIP
jgi:ketosteroid isomerase-like protein